MTGGVKNCEPASRMLTRVTYVDMCVEPSDSFKIVYESPSSPDPGVTQANGPAAQDTEMNAVGSQGQGGQAETSDVTLPMETPKKGPSVRRAGASLRGAKITGFKDTPTRKFGPGNVYIATRSGNSKAKVGSKIAAKELIQKTLPLNFGVERETRSAMQLGSVLPTSDQNGEPHPLALTSDSSPCPSVELISVVPQCNPGSLTHGFRRMEPGKSTCLPTGDVSGEPSTWSQPLTRCSLHTRTNSSN